MEERNGGRVCEIEGGENKMVLEGWRMMGEARRRDANTYSIHPFVLRALFSPKTPLFCFLHLKRL